MALHKESVLDPRFGDYVNHDFAEYHIATNADVGTIDVSWIDEDDPYILQIAEHPPMADKSAPTDVLLLPLAFRLTAYLKCIGPKAMRSHNIRSL